jgi:type I restriction enzyme S subunit
MTVERGVSNALIPLGAIARCQYGLSEKSDPQGDRLYIGMGQLQSGRVVADGANRLTVSAEIAARYGLALGDVLFNRTNSLDLVGKTAMVRDASLVGAVFASYLVRLKVDATRYDSRFLNLWLNTRDSISKLKRLASPGVAQFNIRPSLLAEKFLVPNWPLNIQTRVGDVESIFEAVDADYNAQVQAKRTFRRGLARALLSGERRLNGFTKSNRRQPGEFGTVPSDWTVVSIADFASEVKTRGAVDGSIVYSCTKHDGLVPSLEYFGKQVFSRNLDNYKRLQVGDFAYATNHIDEGSIGLLREGSSPGLVSPMYTVFRPGGQVNPDYLYLLLKTESYRRVFEARMSASVERRGSLRWRDFSRVRVPLPSRREQDRIVDTLRMLDTEIELLQALRLRFNTYKRSLISRLLSGEMQVSA